MKLEILEIIYQRFVSGSKHLIDVELLENVAYYKEDKWTELKSKPTGVDKG